ncbi:MAG TPA: cytochrome P450 [Mycobacteriales bacterium]|jgi:cytochrome P450|nr:cytochrome P450 [Mycobacteriales bacterium]
MSETVSEFDFTNAPMAKSRTDGWRWVRDAGEVFQAANGTWILTSPEAVQYAHRNPDLFSSAKAFDQLGSPVTLIPIAIDPPDHARYRRVLDPMLAPKVINEMDEALRAQARELIQAFIDRGECDIVDDLARLYPTQVFLTVFGLPLADRDQFIQWAETIIENSGQTLEDLSPELVENALALFGYLQTCIADKRAKPGDDMLSRILSIEGDEAWTEEEVLGLCFLFVLAGLDTVTAMIGFMMHELARDPELRKRIIADNSLVQPMIEEVLRLEPPAPMTPRVTTCEVEVCGVTIPADSLVMLCLGTINRDSDTFPQADSVDLDQADKGHRAFGGGNHRCLGSHLARRELRIIAEEFHKLVPDYQIAPGFEPEIAWPSGTFHLKHLPLVFAAAAIR